MSELRSCPFCGGDSADYMPDRLMAPGADPPVFCHECHASAMDAESWNRRAANWQPIETAPRDGTLIRGWGPVAWYESNIPAERSEAREVQMLWVGTDGSIEDGAAWLVPTATPYGYYCWPTHWRPLPEGPADDAITAPHELAILAEQERRRG